MLNYLAKILGWVERHCLAEAWESPCLFVGKIFSRYLPNRCVATVHTTDASKYKVGKKIGKQVENSTAKTILIYQMLQSILTKSK